MSSTPCLEDEQRVLLSEVAAVEAEEARLFARKMVLRARMAQLWNPPVPNAQEQFGVLELAGTARIGQARASSQLVNGARLVRDLPGTLAALQEGVLFAPTAVLLLELTRSCAPEVVREVERRLLPVILTANTTEVRRLVLALIPEVEADLDPELTERRLADAHARRSVWLTDRGEGVVDATGQMDAISAKRWAMDVEELVRAQKLADDRAGIVRTADQRRADVFAQLPSRFLALLHAVRNGKTEQLLALSLADPDLADDLEALAATLPFPLAEAVGARASDPPFPDPPDPAPHWTDLSLLELASTVLGLPVNNPLVLNVHVPMTTLLELDNRAATLDQGGAVPESVARRLVPDATLRRVLVDAASGIPLGIDPQLLPPRQSPPGRSAGKAAPAPDERLWELLTEHTVRDAAQAQHDPSPRLRRFVELRDQQCTGIGCSQPARRCHLDHETAYPTGPTAGWNLSAKSARCHRAKHAGWTVTRHGPKPQPGDPLDGAPPGSTTWTSPLGHSYTRLSPWTHAPAPARAELLIEIDPPALLHAA